MKFPEDLIGEIKGFLDYNEAKHLYDIALAASAMGPCLEIGSYCGKSAVCLGAACHSNGSILFSIDHHMGSEEQQPGEEYFDPELYDPRAGRINTIPFLLSAIRKAGLERTVVPIVSDSATVAKSWATPLALVFIDGSHSPEAASTDYRCWARHIMPGGFLLIHDIFENPEEGGQAPYEVYRTALESGIFEPHSRVKTLGVLRRNTAAG
ncbi:MAG: hypothetical protein B5M56_08045 [Desulfococcus sp. 4484_241]|nr:MAG: hypothetical protein B5M56_08045 [Desulfococcus sp. 4484_241]